MNAPARQPSHDDSPIAAAMFAAGWSDEMVGAAFRAGLGAERAHVHALPGGTVENGTVATVPKLAPLPAEQASNGTVDISGLQVGNSPKAMARAAMAQHPHLTRSAARVGAAILDHHNTKNGRCDPSIQRLVVRSGVSRRSVCRAIKALENYGILSHKICGGRHHCNFYTFDFERCAMLAQSTIGDSANSASPDTQTLKENITTTSLSVSEVVGRKGKAKPPDMRQAELPVMRPIASGKRGGAITSSMPYKKASARLWKAFDGLHQGRGSTFASSIPPEVWDDGVCAEMYERGSGLGVLQAGLMPEVRDNRTARLPP